MKEAKDTRVTKDKIEKERPKEPNRDAVKVFVGKDVVIILRGGKELKGKLEAATHYELIVTINHKPVLVMKHAVDYVELND